MHVAREIANDVPEVAENLFLTVEHDPGAAGAGLRPLSGALPPGERRSQHRREHVIKAVQPPGPGRGRGTPLGCPFIVAGVS